jgi:hypothetical protein
MKRRQTPDPPTNPPVEPDHSHEHWWESQEISLAPRMEDGAAIFLDECNYAEGRYGEGWECEETRQYRFEYSTLETPGGEVIDLPDINNWDDANEKVQNRVVQMEEAFHEHGPGDRVSWDVDPDPDCGVVSISHAGFVLKYEP